MDLQIDDFYKDAASGLLMLYQAFPRKMALYVEDLIGREEPDEFGLPSKRHQACLGALLWLAEEGYLRFESTIAYDALDQAVLTREAFVRLSAPAPQALLRELSAASNEPELPPSVQKDLSTYIHLLRSALKSGSSSRISLAVQSTFFNDSGLQPVH